VVGTELSGRRTSVWAASHRSIIIAACGEAALLVSAFGWRTAIAAEPSGGWADLAQRGWGAIVIVVGTLVWSRGILRIGPLIVATGTAHYCQELRSSNNQLLFCMGFCLAYLWVATFSHLTITWPDGRVRSSPSRVLIAVGYASMIGTQVARYLIDRPYPSWPHGTGRINTPWTKATAVTVIVFTIAIVVFLGHRWLTATPLGRRWSAVAWGGAVITLGLAVFYTIANLLGAPDGMQKHLELFVLYSGLLVGAVAIIVHARRTGTTQSRIAVQVLGNGFALAHPRALQEALAGALGDPQLRIALPAAGEGAYRDVDQNPLSPTSSSPGRVWTPVQRHGRLLAVIEHDGVLDQQHSVAEAVFAIAGMAIENAYLDAERIRQIAESRRRMETAQIEERSRIARDLHDGAQNGLFAVLILLDAVRTQLTPPQTARESAARRDAERAHALLEDASRTLRELTHAVHPAALTEQGLRPALEALANNASIPLTVNVPTARWPSRLEFAAYFIIAEALANIRKHAAATRAEISAREEGAGIVIEIADDGRGGAVPGAGIGLRNMQDRAASAGGTLNIDSPTDRGTRITARLPLELLHEGHAR
jgi:signal transduction histidine kinase